MSVLEPDDTLWAGIGRRDLATHSEVYRRDGDAAYAVAKAITRDCGAAQQAVAAAFVRLITVARFDERRSVRVELLDATRQCAGEASRARDRRRRDVGDVFQATAPSVRDALALAVAAGCGCAEVAQILRVSRDRVEADLVAGLRQARALMRIGAATEAPHQLSS